jgi:serine/threonine protein kinase
MAPTPAGSGTKHKYTKENKVGEGTYAIVYLGRQSGTNRRVAIKAIRIGGFKDGPSDLVYLQAYSRDGYVRRPRNQVYAGTSSREYHRGS